MGATVDLLFLTETCPTGTPLARLGLGALEVALSLTTRSVTFGALFSFFLLFLVIFVVHDLKRKHRRLSTGSFYMISRVHHDTDGVYQLAGYDSDRYDQRSAPCSAFRGSQSCSQGIGAVTIIY